MQKKNIPRTLIYWGYPVLFFALVLGGISSCVAFEGEPRKKTAARPVFNLPAIPELLTEPEARTNYLVLHYWDHFNFADTAYIHLPEITEQAFADYAHILPLADYTQAVQSISRTLSGVEQEKSGRMYTHFLDLFEKYLYDPNSPLRNEEYYIPVVEYILQDGCTDETNRIRPRARLEVMQKNRPGKIATNFTYTLADGKSRRLYGIRSTYTVLYFYNPDCDACREVTEELKAYPVINRLIDNETLSVLALYPDEEVELWKNYHPQLPARWIHAYDREMKIMNHQLYDLKAMPTLYLLDKDKRVILKDVGTQYLEGWLGERHPMLN